MRTPKQVILNALQNHRGDDLERATAAFRNFSDKQLDEQWGQSGQTCRQILEEYRAHTEEVEMAIEFAMSLPD